ARYDLIPHRAQFGARCEPDAVEVGEAVVPDVRQPGVVERDGAEIEGAEVIDVGALDAKRPRSRGRWEAQLVASMKRATQRQLVAPMKGDTERQVVADEHAGAILQGGSCGGEVALDHGEPSSQQPVPYRDALEKRRPVAEAQRDDPKRLDAGHAGHLAEQGCDVGAHRRTCEEPEPGTAADEEIPTEGMLQPPNPRAIQAVDEPRPGPGTRPPRR